MHPDEVPSINRRRFLMGSASLALLAACSGTDSATDSNSPAATPTTAPPAAPTPAAAATPTAATPAPVAADALAAPGSPGLVDEAYFQQRVDSFVSFATESQNPGSPSGIGLHLAAAHRDPDYVWDIEAVTVSSLERVFTKIDEWRDTRDFDFMYLNWILVLGQGDTPMTTIDPAVIDAIRDRTLANRFRYNDPLPDDRIDHLWYWSENHRVITLANEHLAGEFFPDDTFAITGLTGAEHAARTKPELLEWIRERGEFGFFEWHSNVYMAKNITPLLMLCELSDDVELVLAAAVGLDACLMDMATHYLNGSYVAPHGRTYKKDKMTARHEDTFDVAKLLFDRTPGDYESPTSTTASYFCSAQRYRPPQVVIDIAQDDSVSITRERHGIYADASEPLSDNPVAPFGYDYNDPDNLGFWWSLGALGMWQLAPQGNAQADEFRLWDGDAFSQVKLLRDAQGGDVDKLMVWQQANHMILNLGFLSEANTYAWRSPNVSLASVVDHRKGEMRDQVHIWQATIDPFTKVFTTHPMTGLPESEDWSEDEGPGYWTGEASMPRSAQFERTAVHLYLPAYDETTDPLLGAFFRYRDYTHAYFPQDHFDEVREVDGWVLGAKNGGYVALWSWRETAWREYGPGIATNGMVLPFDLIAEGGADNVWVVEVGTEADGSFDDFVSAITAAAPQVERSGDDISVTWSSPTAGELSFGWNDPFVVAGSEEPVSDFPRHESPWGNTERLAMQYEWERDGEVLGLDFDTLERRLQ